MSLRRTREIGIAKHWSANGTFLLLRQQRAYSDGRWVPISPRSLAEASTNMKTRSMVWSLVFYFIAASFASDSNLGTWKLSEAKSRFSATAVKNRTVVYEAEGNNVKVSFDAVDSQERPIHSEWTGKFDGTDYPVAGDPTATTRSYKKIDDHTIEFAEKRNGKITLRGRVVVATDGKNQTVTAIGTDANGKKIKFTAVYDKE